MNIDYNDNIIEDLKITEMQVLNIVSVWYVNGMMPDIIQNEDGFELDEITNDLFFEQQEELNSCPPSNISKLSLT